MNKHNALRVSVFMRQTQCVVRWKEGLHLQPAARLVRLARASKSAICLKVGAKVADARSILAILLLCASVGTVVDLEINGDDEDATLTAITRVFNQEYFRDERSCHRSHHEVEVRSRK